MKTRLFTFFTLILVTVSCSSVSKIQTDDVKSSKLISTNADIVEVYSTKTAKKSYTVIGQVVSCADAGEDSKIAVNLLKQQASLLGADAVIDLRLTISMGYWTNGIKANGTAVKYN